MDESKRRINPQNPARQIFGRKLKKRVIAERAAAKASAPAAPAAPAAKPKASAPATDDWEEF